MPLPAGTRLGPYEIVSLLGSGGMGEVHRARDTRPAMARDVAIKILTGAGADAESRRRFEQEARAMSALNHPHLLAIYDVGVHEGRLYLVEELLEGRTLREVLASGPVPPRRAVDYARAIAEGLAAAHARGIVHRDLKPENVMLTADGRIKILDFGIAKLQQPEAASTTTTEAHLTGPGTIVGTRSRPAGSKTGRPTDATCCSTKSRRGACSAWMCAKRRPRSWSQPQPLLASMTKRSSHRTAGGCPITPPRRKATRSFCSRFQAPAIRFRCRSEAVARPSGAPTAASCSTWPSTAR